MATMNTCVIWVEEATFFSETGSGPLIDMGNVTNSGRNAGYDP